MVILYYLIFRFSRLLKTIADFELVRSSLSCAKERISKTAAGYFLWRVFPSLIIHILENRGGGE